MGRRFTYDIVLFARTEQGKEYMMTYKERVFADDEVQAIETGVRRIPSEVMRRPVTRVAAHRVMSR